MIDTPADLFSQVSSSQDSEIRCGSLADGSILINENHMTVVENHMGFSNKDSNIRDSNINSSNEDYTKIGKH
jgi:hypothetical protein